VPSADLAWPTQVIRGGCGVPGCADPECEIEYGFCHCGCGRKTYLPRQSDKRLNLVKDEPQRYVHRHQLAGALEKRWEPSAADRGARQRTCARDGCEVVFTPTPAQIRRGVGSYCSHSCAKRIHPVPKERECARPACSVRFVPDAHKAAHGRGRYCSRQCRDADRWRFGRARVPITCLQCGRQHIVKSPYYIGRQRFCGSTCWARWRKVHAIKTLRVLRGDVRKRLAGTTNLLRSGDRARHAKGEAAAREVGRKAITLVRQFPEAEPDLMFRTLLEHFEGRDAVRLSSGELRPGRDPEYRRARARLRRRLERAHRDLGEPAEIAILLG